MSDTIIDFHAHAFQDRIAYKAVKNLGDHYEMRIPYLGKADEIIQKAEEAGVDKVVLHTAATSPKQVMPNNDWQASLQKRSEKIVAFGSIHPGFTDFHAELDRMEELGLRGIKLHPDFQHFDIDDPQMMPIYEAIGSRFVIMMHVGDKKFDHSNPNRLVKVLDKFPDLKVIAAHLGGYSCWEEDIHPLVGRDIYIDTSSSLSFISPELAVDIIRQHGVDRVLFGTDYPLTCYEEELPIFNNLLLTGDERKKILGENALNLLAEMKL